MGLSVAVLALFLRVGETEESDDFEEKALEYGASEVEDAESEVCLKFYIDYIGYLMHNTELPQFTRKAPLPLSCPRTDGWDSKTRKDKELLCNM